MERPAKCPPSVAAPLCGGKQVFSPPWGLPTTWKNGQVGLWVVLGVFPGNAKTKTHERTRKMEGFRSVGMSNHRKLAETNAWDRR